VPGRKTVVSDSKWLTQLARFGLRRGSFIPPGSQSISEIEAVECLVVALPLKDPFARPGSLA
jgi:hypothetical protein